MPLSLIRSVDGSTIRVTGRRMAATTTGEIIPIPLITPMAGIMAVITENTMAAADTVDSCRNNEEREWKHSLFLFWEMSNIILLES